jgi:hypothetical protein
MTSWRNIPKKKNKIPSQDTKYGYSIQPDTPYSETDFKEMFQNIYSNPTKEGFKEGMFDIFGEDYDMHRKPKSGFKFSGANEFYAILKEITDYILCPIYKSDRLIDGGIQSILSVFLAVNCGNDEKVFTSTTEILNMGDLIDPNLLYSDASSNNQPVTYISESQFIQDNEYTESIEQFTNIREGLKGYNTLKTKMSEKDCGSQQKSAANDIKAYSKTIKDEVYKILFLPVVIHIFYNIYFMFCHKDILGHRYEFINIEEKYYDPYVKEYLDFFFDVIIRPVTWLYWIYESISKNKTLRWICDSFPYISYILLFIFVFCTVEYGNKNIIEQVGNLLSGKSTPFRIFSILVMVISFFKVILNKTIFEWFISFAMNPMTTAIKWLIWVILKLVVNILLYKWSGYICVLYTLTYLFFGIFISQEKDVFEVYEEMTNNVLDKIYEMYDQYCGADDSYYGIFIHIIQNISKYTIFYLFEFALLYILLKGMQNYMSTMNNVNVQSFLLILNFTGIIILGVWMFMKYFSQMREMDDKYNILNKSERNKEYKQKKEQAERVKEEKDAKEASEYVNTSKNENIFDNIKTQVLNNSPELKQVVKSNEKTINDISNTVIDISNSAVNLFKSVDMSNTAVNLSNTAVDMFGSFITGKESSEKEQKQEEQDISEEQKKKFTRIPGETEINKTGKSSGQTVTSSNSLPVSSSEEVAQLTKEYEAAQKEYDYLIKSKGENISQQEEQAAKQKLQDAELKQLQARQSLLG